MVHVKEISIHYYIITFKKFQIIIESVKWIFCFPRNNLTMFSPRSINVIHYIKRFYNTQHMLKYLDFSLSQCAFNVLLDFIC